MTRTTTGTSQTGRDRLAMLLLGVAALGALVAFVGAVDATRAARPDAQVVES